MFGLHQTTEASSKEYQSRFGEVVWSRMNAKGDYWPSYIYDPREPIIATNKSLGNVAARVRKGSWCVYYFGYENGAYVPSCCNSNGFATSSNIMEWEEGIKQGNHKKKVSTSHVKFFKEGIEQAKLEIALPNSERLKWRTVYLEPSMDVSAYRSSSDKDSENDEIVSRVVKIYNKINNDAVKVTTVITKGHKNKSKIEKKTRSGRVIKSTEKFVQKEEHKVAQTIKRINGNPALVPLWVHNNKLKEAQQYVKNRKKDGRPDLTHWKTLVNSSLGFGNPSRLQSNDVKCKTCDMMMSAVSDKFCWNRMCHISPIYHKLLPRDSPTPTSEVSLCNFNVHALDLESAEFAMISPSIRATDSVATQTDTDTSSSSNSSSSFSSVVGTDMCIDMDVYTNSYNRNLNHKHSRQYDSVSPFTEDDDDDDDDDREEVEKEEEEDDDVEVVAVHAAKRQRTVLDAPVSSQSQSQTSPRLRTPSVKAWDYYVN
jgi:hypothetical protein